MRRVAAEIAERVPHIDVLVNNAGAVFRRRELTAEGHERTWALNVLSPFLLTDLLLGRLRESAPSRVVNVSSAAHHGARIDLADPEAAQRYSGYRQYGASKLALVVLTYELARRLSGSGITVNALHPGFVQTEFGQNNGGGFALAIRVLAFLFAIRPDAGARTSVFLSTSGGVEGVTGHYFVRGRSARSSPVSYDAALRRQLWQSVCAASGVSWEPFGGAPNGPAAQ